MRNHSTRRRATGLALALVATAIAPVTAAQAAPEKQAPSEKPAAKTAAAPSSPASPPMSLDALAWLRGCWKGSVNRREFIEQWSPARGGMMVGFSHTVVAPKDAKETTDAAGKTTVDPSAEKTQDFEYLRLEARPDGVYYVAVPSGKKEVAFRLTETSEDSGAKIFTFTNVVDEFPQRLIYRHGSEGWLYAEVAGKSSAADKSVPGAKPAAQGAKPVIYPMRHVDCATDAQLKE